MSAIDPVATVAELIGYMSGVSLSETQRTDAERSLRGLQSELELFLNRPMQLNQIREYCQADSMGYLNPAVTPIHEIITLERVNSGGLTNIASIPIVKTPLVDIDDENIRAFDVAAEQNTTNFIIHGGINNGTPGQWYLLEYIGGYIGSWDDGVKQALLRVAAREVGHNHDDTVSLREDKAETAAQPDNRQIGWTKDELERLSRLRRRVMARG